MGEDKHRAPIRTAPMGADRSMKHNDIPAGLNIPAGNRSIGQQRRACSSCMTIREFEQCL
jgi:hypothetical protein